MNELLTVQCVVHVERAARGRKQLQRGPEPAERQLPPGRVPRVARFMALAMRLDGLLRAGTLSNYAEVAALGRVTPARISQIMSLVNLAPDLQEAILFLPRTQRGRDPVILRDLQPIAAILDWRKQRVLWQQLTRHIPQG